MVALQLLVWLLVLITDSHAAGSSGSGNMSERDAELIDRLEKSLLASFGLDERPKVDKSKIKIHPYMFELYNQKVKQDLDEREDEDGNKESTSADSLEYASADILGNTVRSFTHSESSKDNFHPSHTMLFRFNVSSVPPREVLQGAQLRIMHFRHPSVPRKPSTSAGVEPNAKRRRWTKEEVIFLNRMSVYDVVRPARGSLEPIHRLVDTRVIDARVNDTAGFDVSSVLKRWLTKPRTNYGIYVEVTPIRSNASLYRDARHVQLRRSVSQEGANNTADEWSNHQPLLIVHTDDPKTAAKPREKRSAPVSSYKRPHCRRYNLHVDFRKIDWNTWIMAPPGYDAFFCQGECPYPLAKHMNATNHAVIQNIIHSRYPNRVPSACCVPIKHSAISMLYVDRNGKIVLKTYQDMIVESCGCQ